MNKKYLFIGASIGAFALFSIYFYNNPIILKQTEFDIEIGESFDPKKNVQNVVFGKNDELDIKNPVDTKKKGEYIVEYRYADKIKEVLVRVDDTVKPVLEVKDLDIDLKTEVEPKSFVTKASDNSKVSLEFEDKPDMDRVGKQRVTIVAKDEYENITKKTVTLNRIDDVTAPVFGKQKTIKIKQGPAKDITSKVKVKDDLDSEPEITLDMTQVDTYTMGKYKLPISAKDKSGNVSKKELTLEVISNPEYNDKVVYLTFDDGPSPNTPKVLDILDKYNVKATFFVTGHDQSCNEYIKQAHDAGHTIGLHTYTHDYATIYSSVDSYFNDLQQISDMVEGITQEKSNVIRFPGGSSNGVSNNYSPGIMNTLMQEVINRGYQYFDWNVSSSDAAGNDVPVSTIVSSSCTDALPQINLLFHDSATKNTTVEALPQIIEYYQAKGYTFYPITQDSFVAHHT